MDKDALFAWLDEYFSKRKTAPIVEAGSDSVHLLEIVQLVKIILEQRNGLPLQAHPSHSQQQKIDGNIGIGTSQPQQTRNLETTTNGEEEQTLSALIQAKQMILKEGDAKIEIFIQKGFYAKLLGCLGSKSNQIQSEAFSIMTHIDPHIDPYYIQKFVAASGIPHVVKLFELPSTTSENGKDVCDQAAHALHEIFYGFGKITPVELLKPLVRLLGTPGISLMVLRHLSKWLFLPQFETRFVRQLISQLITRHMDEHLIQRAIDALLAFNCRPDWLQLVTEFHIFERLLALLKSPNVKIQKVVLLSLSTIQGQLHSEIQQLLDLGALDKLAHLLSEPKGDAELKQLAIGVVCRWHAALSINNNEVGTEWYWERVIEASDLLATIISFMDQPECSLEAKEDALRIILATKQTRSRWMMQYMIQNSLIEVLCSILGQLEESSYFFKYALFILSELSATRNRSEPIKQRFRDCGVRQKIQPYTEHADREVRRYANQMLAQLK